MRALGCVAIAFAFACACGGSTTEDLDGGKDGSTTDAPPASDVANDVAVGDSTPPTQLYDGVVGKACTTDGDCKTPFGPNLAKCSNSVFQAGDFFPTAVCVLPTCNPVTTNNAVHYCDGPDDPSSPGICVTGNGGSICLPKCTYDKQGGAPKGCAGKDACNSYPILAAAGVGYCFGGCTQDTDCQDGQKCQTDRGWCLPGVTPPAKSIGAACTDSDSNGLICNCLYGTNKSGYCSQFCTIGGAACPSGFKCDSLELRVAGYSTPNPGMAGYCTIDCAADAGTCPSSASCSNVFASGPDCVPP